VEYRHSGHRTPQCLFLHAHSATLGHRLTAVPNGIGVSWMGSTGRLMSSHTKMDLGRLQGVFVVLIRVRMARRANWMLLFIMLRNAVAVGN